jgi:hypothetical protein
MMNMKNTMGLVGLVAGLSCAHLVDDTLEPKGGETLTVGQVLAIKWTAQINHPDHAEGVNIALSKDGGATWQSIREKYGDNEKNNTFNWTVPASAATAQGKIRICQSGPCTNSHNANRLTSGPPWVLVSSAFTVQTSTGIASQAQSQLGFSLDYHPDTRNVNVAFALKAAGPVLLQAFDTRGRLVATLIEKDYAAGSHAFSVFSNALGSASGSMVFKLSAAGEVKTHTWMPLR